MRVMLTGAFGNLGSLVLERLLRAGHQLTAFDVPSKVNRKIAAGFANWPGLEIHWGDIRDAAKVKSLVRGQDAVIHLAAVIAPFSELNPELARAINVTGTAHLIEGIAACEKPPLFIFSSSFAVYGIRQDAPPPRTLDEPVVATDHYSAHKIECEEMIRRMPSPWVILRLGAMVDSRMRHTSAEQGRLLLLLDANNRVEYIHPADATTAIFNALSRPDSHYKVHLIGGGPTCQVRQLELCNAITGAMGITFTASDMGSQKLYADWADTRESQRLLDYQHHSFDDFRRENYQRFRWLRPLVRPLSPLIKQGMRTFLGPG